MMSYRACCGSHERTGPTILTLGQGTDGACGSEQLADAHVRYDLAHSDSWNGPTNSGCVARGADGNHGDAALAFTYTEIRLAEYLTGAGFRCRPGFTCGSRRLRRSRHMIQVCALDPRYPRRGSTNACATHTTSATIPVWVGHGSSAAAGLV